MKIKVVASRIIFIDCYSEKEYIKVIPGRKYNAVDHTWSAPYSHENVNLVKQLFNVGLPSPLDRIASCQAAQKTQHHQSFILPYLYKHQKASVKFGRALKCFADLSEPGTGKTLVQIELLLERLDAFPALIICPKSIVHAVWEAQLEKCLPDNNIIYFLENGTDHIMLSLSDLKKNMNKSSIIAIINYEAVAGVIDDLKKIKWSSIILDESTKIKNSKSDRSKAILKLRDGAKYRSIMTGTIAPNNLLDVYNQLRFIEPELFGDSFYAFRDHFFYAAGYENHMWLPKPNTFTDIASRLKMVSIGHLKRECIDLPPLVEELRVVEMSDQQKQYYTQMKEELVLWLRNQDSPIVASFAITAMMKLRQICSGFIYDAGKIINLNISHRKLQETFDLLDEINIKEHKVIIFAHFNATLEYLKNALRHKGLDCILYSSDATSTAKQSALKTFEASPKDNILLANPASAGHGLNLQFCSNIIYYEHDFNLENHLQSMQRIERIGQKNKMTIYHLITKYSVEEYIMKRLRDKKSTSEKLTIDEISKNI